MKIYQKYLIVIAIGLISSGLADLFPLSTWIIGWIGGVLAVSILGQLDKQNEKQGNKI